jgi:hypothetical protein
MRVLIAIFITLLAIPALADEKPKTEKIHVDNESIDATVNEARESAELQHITVNPRLKKNNDSAKKTGQGVQHLGKK